MWVEEIVFLKSRFLAILSLGLNIYLATFTDRHQVLQLPGCCSYCYSEPPVMTSVGAM